MIFIYSFISLLVLHYVLFIISAKRGILRIKNSTGITEELRKVTVIIPFRNEEDIITENVRSINNIDYPLEYLEVIYVNDNSTDDSEMCIKQNITHQNYRIINSIEGSNGRGFKKLAIEQAINVSEGEIIVLTDADCFVPPAWISTLVSYFDDETAMVSGPVTFEQQNNFFENIQKLEFAGLNLMGAGLIGIGNPTICSSANLAFKKSVFLEIGGYRDNLNLSSGDDELLMQKIFNKTSYKIKFCFKKSALVFTRANRSLEEFTNQRIRWASKGLFYKNSSLVFNLVLIFLFYFNMILLPLLSFIIGIELLWFLLLSVCCKFVVEYLVIREGKEFYFDSSLMKLFLPAQVFQIPYIVYAAVAGVFGGFKWKGRNLKR